MSDLFGYGPSFSFPGGVSGPGVSKELRQRIALAMLMQKRKAPSTFGEGLSAIGESIGDIGTMRRLAAEENASFAGGNTKADELLGTTPPAGAQGPSPVQAAAISAPSSLYQPPDQDPRSQAPVPPTVQEGGPTPTTQPMFRPNLRTATPPASALPPAAPAAPAPPDVPGATRLSTPEQMAGFRAQNPLPQNIPPMPPPGGPPPGLPPQAPRRPAPTPQDPNASPLDNMPWPHGNAGAPPQDPNASPLDNMPWPHGNAGAPPPGAPVMAQGLDPASLPMAPPDNPRRAIGLALMKQQMGGQGAPAPAPAPPLPPNQGIAAAPPAAPIQKMPAPQQDVPPAGYVSPTPARVTAPTPEPMSAMEAKLRDAIARDPDGMNGQLGRRLGPVIQTLEANRTAENQRKIDQYKIDLQHEKTMTEKIEEQKASAAQRQLTYQEGQQGLLNKGQPQVPAGVYDPRLGTDQSPQRTGIPDIGPAPPHLSPKEWAETQKAEVAKIKPTVEKAVPQLQESLKLIEMARNHPGRDWGVGPTGSFARERAGTDAHAFGVLMKQIQGKNFMAGYETLKGAGAIGEKEGIKGQEAQASIDPDQHKAAFDASMQRLEDTLRGSVEQAQRKANQPVTAWQRTPNDPVAPDKGERRGNFEYLGGNPEEPANWKKVR